jgi:hypothetical protein
MIKIDQYIPNIIREDQKQIKGYDKISGKQCPLATLTVKVLYMYLKEYLTYENKGTRKL